MKYLPHVNSPADLKQLPVKALPQYCAELREFIIREVSANPGHLGASIGAVELAVAIHYVYDTPGDKVVWDVGHQAYAHKIITGRRDSFHTNRKLGGISGFPRMAESPYDAFGTGHSSTSISAALGLSQALEGRSKVVAVIGDGSMTGGLAFEGLNNAGADLGNDLLVILNDNNMSIDPNVGALKEKLLEISKSRRYNRFKESVWRSMRRIPRVRRTLKKFLDGAKSFFLNQSNLFESFNFRYFGPVDGNDVVALVEALKDIRQLPGPKLLHALTVKGKGYAPAERSQTEWHAPGYFNPDTGEKNDTAPTGRLKFQEVFGHTLLSLARQTPEIVGITPAMPSGSSLCIMMDEMPERAYDVGIAEGHAVTFAAALAAGGKLPFCCIYSSFMQRAVDNVIHDAALQRLPVVLCLDRAGLVGEDGATHHGAFDVALLRSVPDITIGAPLDASDLRHMMYTAAERFRRGECGTFVIRYPRGGSFPETVLEEPLGELGIGRGRWIGGNSEAPVAVLSLGTAGVQVAEALRTASLENRVVHYDMRWAKPLDEDILHFVANRYTHIVTVEDGVRAGGFGSAVLEFLADNGYQVPVTRLGLPDHFVEHGTVAELRAQCGLDAESIAGVLRKTAIQE